MFLSSHKKTTKVIGVKSLTIMLLERLDDAAFLVDNYGKFAYGNSSACNLLGCSATELLTMVIPDLPLTNLPQVWSDYQSSLSSQQALCFTDKYITPIASELAVEITVASEQGVDRDYSCLLIRPVPLEPTTKDSILPSIPQLEQVFKFIEENHARSISLKDVALALGYCPSYLTDLVRRCSGQTVNHWIIKRRIALACKLLQETTQSVNQIALATGYQNEGHFFRQFRQHCGMTPLAWRRLQQKEQSS